MANNQVKGVVIKHSLLFIFNVDMANNQVKGVVIKRSPFYFFIVDIANNQVRGVIKRSPLLLPPLPQSCSQIQIVSGLVDDVMWAWSGAWLAFLGMKTGYSIHLKA